MQPPKDAKVMDWGTSLLWFDGDGVLCSIAQKAPKQTLAQAKEQMDRLMDLIGDKKVCLLIDVTNTSESTKEVRDYAAREFPKFVKAIAMISDSALGKMLANLFFKVKAQPYPVKMFNDVNEAKEWLKQYL